MKKSLFFLAGLLLPILACCQTADTIKRSKLLSTSPLLGGVTLTDIVSPVSTSGGSFVMQQPIADLGIPLYKDFSTEHALLVKSGVRYQGLFLSGDQAIGQSAFQSVTVPLLVNYSLSRTTSLSFIGLATVGSDFNKAIDGSDIQYTIGFRIGFRPGTNFKYGITLTYVKSYSGKFLLPLPDIDWTISKNWSLTGVVPARASLKYKLTPAQSLGATFGLSGNMYRLNTETQSQYLHLQQSSIGMIYDLKLGRRWLWTMVAGHTLSQKLETFNLDQQVPFDGFGKLNDRVSNISYRQNSFIFQGGLSYLF